MNDNSLSPPPRPEFRNLSEETIAAALEQPIPNAISIEVGRLVNEYVEALRRRARDDGGAVSTFLGGEPRWPMEAVAKRLAEGVVCEAILENRAHGAARFWNAKDSLIRMASHFRIRRLARGARRGGLQPFQPDVARG